MKLACCRRKTRKSPKHKILTTSNKRHHILYFFTCRLQDTDLPTHINNKIMHNLNCLMLATSANSSPSNWQSTVWLVTVCLKHWPHPGAGTAVIPPSGMARGDSQPGQSSPALVTLLSVRCTCAQLNASRLFYFRNTCLIFLGEVNQIFTSIFNFYC